MFHKLCDDRPTTITFIKVKETEEILGASIQSSNTYIRYSYEKNMVKYEGESMEWILLMLEPNEKEIILVTHNECIFYSNDGKRSVWAKSGELPLPTSNPSVPEEAQPGKDREGFWTNEYLIEQQVG
ncbi:hypothetical protein RhiirA4_480658 [Rhizophagus irregularis]|uniref:Uncharacterized protein n=1 Tax=Rhizophagus irregularis TaxID=588596 RepID=A0A2I1HI97_9GLOM|nr:hypothetical protein RhiirA4_480658 [Rhizophagus irregularis]